MPTGRMRGMMVGLLVSVGFLITGCGGLEGERSPAGQPNETPSPTVQPSQTPQPSRTPTPKATKTPTVTLTPSLTPTTTLPAESQKVSFTAEDGKSLSGVYYPASTMDAPVVVFMQWAEGDQRDWKWIAAWLQDRGWKPKGKQRMPWETTWWFPDVPDSLDLAVFTFNFRGCEDGCTGFTSGSWLLDAQAGLETAREMPGVDSKRVLAVGASIGADGAVDACQWLNETDPGSCLGAFAISPGSFLTVPYDRAASELLGGSSPTQVYCLFARRDDAALETCQSVPEATVVDYGYVEKHGMELVSPGLDHNTLKMLLEFVQAGLDGRGP